MPDTFKKPSLFQKKLIGEKDADRNTFTKMLSGMDNPASLLDKIPTGGDDTNRRSPKYNRDPKDIAKYKAQRDWRGISDAAFGLGDLENMFIDAAIRDADYFTGGGLSKGTYDPFQFGSASQGAADFTSAATGSEIIDRETMPPDVRHEGDRRQALVGMLPTGGEDAMIPALKLLAGAPMIPGKKALTEIVSKSANKGGEAVPKPAPKGRTNIRNLPPDEALKIAKTEEHIVPKEDGGYVGAPYSMQTREDLDMIRKKFDEDVAAGAGGSDWYERTVPWIKEVAGPDPKRQSQLSRNLALFSAQADPGSNLGFSVKAHNAAASGKPLDLVRDRQKAKTFNKAFESGEPADLGDKTGVFAGHMDPTVADPTTGTNDIWHGRSWGFTDPETGEPWDSSFSPAQHDWLDKETVLAVGRANENKVGGREDWNAGQVQAAPWVHNKAKGLMERFGWSEEKALAEARKTYPDYEENYMAYDQAEDTPGVGTGHRPDIAEGSQAARREYFDDPASGWQDDQGRDILHDAQNSLFKKTQENTGVFNQTDVNPGRTTPMLATPVSDTNRELDEGSAQMLRGPTAMKGFVDVQNMGGNSALFPPKAAKDRNAFELTGLPDNPGEDILRGRMDELTDIIHYGGGRGALTSFGEHGPAIGDLGKPKNAAAVDAHIKSQFGQQAGARPAHFTSAPTFYEEAWQKKLPGADKAGGTGAATEVLFEQLSDRQIDQYDTPAFRAKVKAKFERDQASGAPIREDVQNARFLLMNGGPRALKEALIKGAVTVAAGMGAMLPFTTAGLPSEIEDDENAIRR